MLTYADGSQDILNDLLPRSVIGVDLVARSGAMLIRRQAYASVLLGIRSVAAWASTNTDADSGDAAVN